jgi:hypothetical protein
LLGIVRRGENGVPIWGSSCCRDELLRCHNKFKRRARKEEKVKTSSDKMCGGGKATAKHSRGMGESRMDAEGKVGDPILVFDGVHRYDTGVIVRISKKRCYFRSDRHGGVHWCSVRFVQVLERTGVYV